MLIGTPKYVYLEIYDYEGGGGDNEMNVMWVNTIYYVHSYISNNQFRHKSFT